ncbi:hypothetical protein NX059_006175 [Plenodomus lindquistii]|nr:hypothetical protein NX059_006175 [Plenodomus lindquistii]
MEAETAQIRALYATANTAERQAIQEQLRDLQRDLYTDWEILFGLGTASLQWSLIQIGVDLSTFSTLSSSQTPITHQDLVQSTQAAPSLLSHLLRSFAAFGLITETAKDTFSANRTTRIFTDPHVIGAMPHITDVHAPVAHALPGYLREHKYQDMTDSTDLPFHTVLRTDLSPFE